MTASAAPALLSGLVDDAGLFPPTALPLGRALQRHRADRDDGSGMLTHRFLCPASRITELRSHLEPGDRVGVGLIADTPARELAQAAAGLGADLRTRLEGVEFPLARTGAAGPEAALEASLETVDTAGIPAEVALMVEPGELADLPRLARCVSGFDAGRPLGVKIRCGGPRPELVPGAEPLAEALLAAARHRTRMKATAGLHHAVHAAGPDTGGPRHGFVNLLLGLAEALNGADTVQIAATLRRSGAGEVAERAARLDPATAEAVRGVFTSYGSCDTRTPIREAHRLGLIGAAPPPETTEQANRNTGDGP